MSWWPAVEVCGGEREEWWEKGSQLQLSSRWEWLWEEWRPVLYKLLMVVPRRVNKAPAKINHIPCILSFFLHARNNAMNVYCLPFPPCLPQHAEVFSCSVLHSCAMERFNFCVFFVKSTKIWILSRSWFYFSLKRDRLKVRKGVESNWAEILPAWCNSMLVLPLASLPRSVLSYICLGWEEITVFALYDPWGKLIPSNQVVVFWSYCSF